jgi:hypothetical protein
MMENGLTHDLEMFPKELKLLLNIMKAESNKSLLELPKKLLSEIDWSFFLQLARHHRVFPFIYKTIKEIDEYIPSYVVQKLCQEYQKNTFQMLQLSGEMEQIGRSLSENKIRSLFLKGPVIAANLYGDISLRTSCDLDILISIYDLNRADELLQKLGYSKHDYILTILNDWKWRHHHVTYYHPQKKIKIEIHWRLNPGPSKEPNFDELWDRRRISTLTSYPVCFLGSDDLFLFLVSHGARHGWSRLRWLLDIHQIANQHIDWDDLILLLKKYQYYHHGAQAIILASQLLDTKIPKEMKTIISKNRPRRLAREAIFYIKQMVNLHTSPVPQNVAMYHKRHLFSLMSVQQKILFILSFFHPYHADAETLPLPKYLHVLYYPLRPILLVWRKARKHASP